MWMDSRTKPSVDKLIAFAERGGKTPLKISEGILDRPISVMVGRCTDKEKHEIKLKWELDRLDMNISSWLLRCSARVTAWKTHSVPSWCHKSPIFFHFVFVMDSWYVILQIVRCIKYFSTQITLSWCSAGVTAWKTPRVPLMSLITNILSCFAKPDREPNKLPRANPNTLSTAERN